MIATLYRDFRELVGGAYGIDGFRAWPIADLVSTVAPPWSTWTMSFPVQFDAAGVDDAVPGTDDWHWYLQQPSERWDGSLAETLMVVSRVDTFLGAPAFRSGRVSIGLTAAGTARVTPHSAANVSRLLRQSYLFAYNLALSEFHIWDLHQAAFGP